MKSQHPLLKLLIANWKIVLLLALPIFAAAMASGFRALKKTPPMPVTFSISI